MIVKNADAVAWLMHKFNSGAVKTHHDGVKIIYRLACMIENDKAEIGEMYSTSCASVMRTHEGYEAYFSPCGMSAEDLRECLQVDNDLPALY